VSRPSGVTPISTGFEPDKDLGDNKEVDAADDAYKRETYVAQLIVDDQPESKFQGAI
jgi:hypothetical protein